MIKAIETRDCFFERILNSIAWRRMLNHRLTFISVWIRLVTSVFVMSHVRGSIHVVFWILWWCNVLVLFIKMESHCYFGFQNHATDVHDLFQASRISLMCSSWRLFLGNHTNGAKWLHQLSQNTAQKGCGATLGLRTDWCIVERHVYGQADPCSQHVGAHLPSSTHSWVLGKRRSRSP